VSNQKVLAICIAFLCVCVLALKLRIDNLADKVRAWDNHPGYLGMRADEHQKLIQRVGWLEDSRESHMRLHMAQ
jgi:hypothetical protein